MSVSFLVAAFLVAFNQLMSARAARSTKEAKQQLAAEYVSVLYHVNKDGLLHIYVSQHLHIQIYYVWYFIFHSRVSPID